MGECNFTRKRVIILKIYILKRVLSLIPILFIVSLIVFLIVHLTPGDPVAAILGDKATPDQVEQMRNELGLNAPIHQQYVNWVSGVLRGDLGQSYFMQQTVTMAIASHLGPTISLSILSQMMTIVIGIPIGIIAATRKGTLIDASFMGFSLLGISIPSFLLALFLILLFSVQLTWFPVAGYKPLSNGLWEYLRYLILPAVSLASVQVALTARMTRNSMLEVLNTDYIKTARSKGLSEWKVVYKHALKNAFLPIITIISQSFGLLIAGAVVVETVFNIPGIGQLVINSIERRDFAVIQGIVLFVAVVYISINLVVDLLYGIIDPRVRLNHK